MLVLRGHKKRVRCLAFSPDGNLLASAAGRGHAISLWDTRRGKRIRFLSWHNFVLTSLTFSPGGDLLASADSQSRSQLWDMPSGEPRFRSPAGASRAIWMAFAPDGKTYLKLVWAWPGYDVGRYHTDAAAPLETMRGPRGHPYGIALAPDGQALAVATHLAVDVWDLAAKEIRMSLSQSSPVHAVAYAPDGRTLAVATRRRVTLWDTTGGASRAALKGHDKLINSIAFTPDGRALLSGSNDGTVRVWDVASGRQSAAYDWQIGRVHVVAVAPDGMRAAAGGDAAIVVWDLDGLPA